jgi:imidazolonepropionase-like amidohydrolase
MTYSLIHNGTVIDGNGRSPLKNGAVLIRDNKIEQVGRKSDLRLPNSDITMLDAQGGFILPGLIDSHVHVVFDGINFMQEMNTPYSLNYYKAMEPMRRTLEAGITSVRDAGGADLGMKHGGGTGPHRRAAHADQHHRAQHHRRSRRQLAALWGRHVALPSHTRPPQRHLRRRGRGAQEGA